MRWLSIAAVVVLVLACIPRIPIAVLWLVPGAYAVFWLVMYIREPSDAVDAEGQRGLIALTGAIVVGLLIIETAALTWWVRRRDTR
jgi:hypothetical protein